MNAISPFQGAPASMTSQEIAELTGSRHDNVKRTIVRLAEAGTIRIPPLEVSEKNNNLGLSQSASHFKFAGEQGKRDSYVVVAQLSPEFTARLVDRWQELESQQQPQIPQTLSEALRLAADQAEQIEAQQRTIEQQQPAVEFVENYVDSSGSMCIRDAGRTLGVGQKRLVEYLLSNRICYRMPVVTDKGKTGDLRPYHRHEEAGRFEVRTGTNGTHAFAQTRITPKGVAWLAERLKHDGVIA